MENRKLNRTATMSVRDIKFALMEIDQKNETYFCEEDYEAESKNCFSGDSPRVPEDILEYYSIPKDARLTIKLGCVVAVWQS